MSAQNRIQPQAMAEIYFNRMHFASVRAVTVLLDEYRRDSVAAEYWIEVLEILKQKAEARKNG